MNIAVRWNGPVDQEVELGFLVCVLLDVEYVFWMFLKPMVLVITNQGIRAKECQWHLSKLVIPPFP